jgi:hypothetical protein
VVSSTNKTDRHGITETLLKVALNTIKPTQPNQSLVVLNTKQIENQVTMRFNEDIHIVFIR